MLRNLAIWIYTPFAWSIFMAVTMGKVVLGFCAQLAALPFDPQRKTALRINRLAWGHALFLLEPGFPIRRQGMEQVGPGPYIVVCNHSSVLDIPACMGLPLPLRVVGKTALFRIPLMGWYMRFTRQIPVDGSSPDSVRRAQQLCRDALDQGVSVLMFPEGTRSEDASLGKFNRAAFRLAKDTGYPVLPVAVFGTHNVLRKGRLRAWSVYQQLRMKVMPPMSPEGFTTARAFSNRVRSAVSSGLDQLRGEPA